MALIKSGMPAPVGALKMAMGYVWVKFPEHHRANDAGYVMLAIVVWERRHERPFPDECEPHHRNGRRDDDSPGNVLAVTHSQHMKLHALIRMDLDKARRYEGRLVKRQLFYRPDKALLEELYGVMIAAGIGAKFGVSGGTANRWLIEHGIDRRRTGPR